MRKPRTKNIFSGDLAVTAMLWVMVAGVCAVIANVIAAELL